MMGFINLNDKSYMPVNGFTTMDLGCERGNNAYNMVQKTEIPVSTVFIELFKSLWNDSSRMQVVTDKVIDSITGAYQENAPDFIYFVTLYNIFNEFLEDITEDVLPNEATGFKNSKIWNMLYNFQKDAALAIVNRLEISDMVTWSATNRAYFDLKSRFERLQSAYDREGSKNRSLSDRIFEVCAERGSLKGLIKATDVVNLIQPFPDCCDKFCLAPYLP